MADDIGSWLQYIGLEKYTGIFAENDIDLDVVATLTDADLKELGLSLGDRRRYLRAVETLDGDGGGGKETADTAEESKPPDPAVLEGERKQVTVLFADVVNSTKLITELDVESAAELLRFATAVMMDAVRKNRGTVNKVLGDGIMVIFGAPISYEDHAVRACNAAIDMLTGLARARAEIGQTEAPEIQIRIGINSGDVVVRSIHNDHSIDYDAIGMTTHLAARMEKIAGAGRCVMTRSTYRLVKGFISAKSLGPVKIQGLDAPIEVFELSDSVDVQSRFDVSRRDALTQFVGRDAEMQVLQDAWNAARAGSGQSVAMAGDAGIGKSRILHEFIQTALTENSQILRGGGLSHKRTNAFYPLLSLLKNYFDIADTDGVQQIQQQVRAKSRELTTVSAAAADLVAGLLGATDSETWNSLAPAQRRSGILDSCVDVLLTASRKAPVVIVFEDLQWFDAETTAFLEALVDRLGDAPLLLLLNYRPEFKDPWRGQPHHTILDIAPLKSNSTREMLGSLLSGDVQSAELQDLLLDRTDGNPFFIEETIYSLIEDGSLLPTSEGMQLAVPVAELDVPPSVTAVLGERIDRLAPETKRLLQTASVIGTQFEGALLGDVTGIEQNKLSGMLGDLEKSDFVYRAGSHHQEIFNFRHALTHQVAYQGLLRHQRKLWHAKTLNVLEGQDSGERYGQLEQLLHHALGAEVWDKVAANAMKIGQQAMVMSASQSALDAFDHASKALQRLPDTEDNLRAAIDCRLNSRAALYVLGGSPRMVSLMNDARRLAERLDDKRQLAEIILAQSGNQWMSGYYRSARALAGEALALLEHQGDIELTAVAHYRLSTAALHSGDYLTSAEQALIAADLLQPVMETYSNFGGLAYSLVGSFGAIALAELGRFEEGVRLGGAAFDLAVRHQHAYSISVGCVGIGEALAGQGDYPGALQRFEEGLRQVDVHGVTATLYSISARTAYVLSKLGRFGDADAILRRAFGQDLSGRSKSMAHPSGLIWAARACLVAEKTDDAEHFADLAAKQGNPDEPNPGIAAWSAWISMEIARLAGRNPSASPSGYEKLAEQAQQLGMKQLYNLCQARLQRAAP